MSFSKSAEYDCFASSDSIAVPVPRTIPKSSVFKSLKKLVISPAQSSSPSYIASCTPVETQQRRAEALSSCGLLKQSVKYGAPYRDEDAMTIVSPETYNNAGNSKAHLISDEDDEPPQERENAANSDTEKIMSVYSPAPPHSPLSPYAVSSCSSSDSASIVESDTSTLASKGPDIRIRRIRSMYAEIGYIEDEESRHLTKVAFLG